MNVDLWGLVLQVATLIAVIVAAWQLLFHSRQMHREFESLYIARYWELMDRRSRGWVSRGHIDRDDLVVVKGYLQLCEDEIDCRRIGRITDSTWHFWREAILTQAAEGHYLRVLRAAPESDYPLLRQLVLRGPIYEPLSRGWLWRKTHGL